MRGWDPFHDLLTIQDRMNKLFETVLTGPAPLGDLQEIGTWRPLSEVVETPFGIDIECEIAGVDRSAIDIRVDGHHLIIEGERTRPPEATGWTWHRVERAYGKLSRRFELPPGLDLDHVDAALDNGILHITVPKRPEARPRRIPVGGSGPVDN
ncbi:MAG: Hsp20/alpha crystallin family protein [Acidobacteria bacterium]|nr:Hsp20/alpha crystallin family protein [Acidobacteriota bacterium]